MWHIEHFLQLVEIIILEKVWLNMFRPICQSGQFANWPDWSADLQIAPHNLPIIQESD